MLVYDHLPRVSGKISQNILLCARAGQLYPRGRAALCREQTAAIKLMQRARRAAPRRRTAATNRRPLLAPYEADLATLAQTTSDRAAGGATAPLRHQRRALDDPQPVRPDPPEAKKESLRAAEQDRPDVANRRRLPQVWQRFMDPSRFASLGETGTATNMARCYVPQPVRRALGRRRPPGALADDHLHRRRGDPLPQPDRAAVRQAQDALA
jgi:hypothetical protein